MCKESGNIVLVGIFEGQVVRDIICLLIDKLNLFVLLKKSHFKAVHVNLQVS